MRRGARRRQRGAPRPEGKGLGRQAKARLALPRSCRPRRAGAAPAASLTPLAPRSDTVVVALAADSGCGKSTFMRRMISLFGGDASPPAGGNPDSNTLISDTTTVICLDDYHMYDRAGRKEVRDEETGARAARERRWEARRSRR